MPEESEHLYELMQAYADHCEESAWVDVNDSLPEIGVVVIVEYKPSRPMMEGTLLGADERMDAHNSGLPRETRENVLARRGFRMYNVLRWRPFPQKISANEAKKTT